MGENDMPNNDQTLVLKDEIPPLKIGQIPYMLPDNLPTLSPENSVSEAAKVLNQNRIGIASVTAPDNRFLGVISKTDIVQVVADWPNRIPDLQIKHLYTSDAITCTTEDSSVDILMIMRKQDLRHLPIVEDGVMIGLLSIDNLRSYLTHSPTAQPSPRHDTQKNTTKTAPPPNTDHWEFDDLEGETVFKSYIEDDDLDEHGEPRDIDGDSVLD